MTKKYVLMGAIAAFLAAANLAHAPIIEEISILERGVKKIEERRRIQRQDEETRLWEIDLIYRKIKFIYDNINPPSYITKKFIRCLGIVESEDFPKAVSKAGAKGWGQLMEEAWYSVEDSNYEQNVFNLDKNIETTIKYLVWIDNKAREWHSDWDRVSDEEKVRLIAAAYNGGIGRLEELNWDIKKMPEETRQYIPKLEQLSKIILPSSKIYQSNF